jgi:hypothetical protein
MRKPAKHGEFTKILVKCHQDSAFTISMRQDGFVAGILRPVACPSHVVASSLQLSFGAHRKAGVQKELQRPASIVRVSMRSFAAILRA